MADDKRLERIEDKIDSLSTHLSSIDSTLAGQHVQLSEHIRRTSILEDTVKPIKEHVDMVKGAMKLIAIIGSIILVAEGLKALIGS